MDAHRPAGIVRGRGELTEADRAAFARMDAELAARQAELPRIRAEGEAALRRLLPIANGNTGQCRHVAAFLLGLYNGRRFPFDLTALRAVDSAIFDDCMAVLRMDHNPEREVQNYFDEDCDKGHEIWEGLAKRWGIEDRLAGTGEL